MCTELNLAIKIRFIYPTRVSSYLFNMYTDRLLEKLTFNVFYYWSNKEIDRNSRINGFANYSHVHTVTCCSLITSRIMTWLTVCSSLPILWSLYATLRNCLNEGVEQKLVHISFLSVYFESERLYQSVLSFL